MKNIMFKAFAIVMCIATLVVSLPMAAFAIEEKEVEYVEDSLENEISSLRTETSKQFELSSGNIVAIDYGKPVHMNVNGQLININNEMVFNTKEYVTNNTGISFAQKITDKESLLKIGSKIKIGINNIENEVEGKIKNQETKLTEEDDEIKRYSTLDKLYSEIKYENIYEGIDLEYILSGLDIKENIIVNEKRDSYAFSFSFLLDGYKIIEKENEIRIVDFWTNETKYIIPQGYMYDAEGNHSEKVEYEIKNNLLGSYTLTVRADSEWINSDERKFPVTIDPTIQSEATAQIINTYINRSTS